MDSLLSGLMQPASISPLFLIIGGIVLVGVGVAIGRALQKGRGGTADLELGNEMRRMRRENVTLAEERDQLRESLDRDRRRARRGGSASEMF
ncbi:MAG: hypothetical protein AAF968_08730 [Pseudomonadota bacterium]